MTRSFRSTFFASQCRRLMAVFVLAFMGVTATHADTLTSNVQTSATLTNDCQVAATPLAFGAVSGISSAANTQSTVSVTCTSGTAYAIGMNAGSWGGSTIAQREMLTLDKTHYIRYSVTQDSAHAQNWGQTAGTDTVNGTGTGAMQSYPVYGQIVNAGQYPIASFADTITVSITY